MLGGAAPPEELEPEAVLEPEVVLAAGVDVLGAAAVSVFGFASLGLLSLLELSAPFLAPLLLYRSAYQPPPLRMKPAPPEIWRLAVASWQCGHSVIGAALIDCSASQAWPQAVQAYS